MPVYGALKAPRLCLSMAVLPVQAIPMVSNGRRCGRELMTIHCALPFPHNHLLPSPVDLFPSLFTAVAL